MPPLRADIKSPRAAVFHATARVVRPRPRLTCSAWTERYITLTKEQSPHRPGPFRCDWKPWGRAIHDVREDNPGKEGAITIKPAQIGYTRRVLNTLLADVDLRPGPSLFLISDQAVAAHYADEHFIKNALAIEHLRPKFYRDLHAPKNRDARRRELVLEKPYEGGSVSFAGSGSVGKVASRTYGNVYIDEYEIFMDNWRSAAGDGFTFAEARVSALAGEGWVETWSHPRRKGEGIHKLYTDVSTMTEWSWDCPHEACRRRICPRWNMVHFVKADQEAGLDPATAVLKCPHCGNTITDEQRAAAVWGPGEGGRGGSGRFEGDLSPEKAARRRYVGRRIHILSDPDVSVRTLAGEYVSKCGDPAQLMAWLNTRCGEEYEDARRVVTAELVDRCVQATGTIAVPGGMMGCQFMTVGVDVQAPESNPILYVEAAAWSVSGHKFIVSLVKLHGWVALTAYLRTLMVPVDEPGPGAAAMVLTPMLCTIDCGAYTGRVLDFCRIPIISEHGHQVVKILPVRHAPHVKVTAPATMGSEQKRTNPMRPELGAIDLWDLHRHTWVDRAIGRIANTGVSILCPLPEDYKAQVTSNHLVPIEDQHGMTQVREEWFRPKELRDDWLQCGVYNEAGAALDPLTQLDRLHEWAAARAAEEPSAEADRGEGYWGDAGEDYMGGG